MVVKGLEERRWMIMNGGIKEGNKGRWGSRLDVYGGKGKVDHRLYIGGGGDKRKDGILKDKK